MAADRGRVVGTRPSSHPKVAPHPTRSPGYRLSAQRPAAQVWQVQVAVVTMHGRPVTVRWAPDDGWSCSCPPLGGSGGGIRCSHVETVREWLRAEVATSGDQWLNVELPADDR